MTDHDIPRDRHGRPLIKDGEKLVPYQRTSSFGSVLEDTYQLAKWQQRNVALGLVYAPSLYGQVAAAGEQDTQRLNLLCELAQEEAGSKEKAEYGTRIHELCEAVDKNWALSGLTHSEAADVAAYATAVADHELVLAEKFTVQDTLKVAGTPDQIRTFKGKHRVYDIKTGSVKYGMVKIAIQLAVYAHSVLYDWKTETRTPYPVDVDLNEAIVIHLPAGKGTAELLTVDIKEGWERAKLAKKVLEARSVAGLSRKFVA